ncbi:MAG: hypothetical protein U1C97_02620, partial [Candidatus Gracilibacteria bacterium]|nr:hypothetical protein [Candidatus Gracilibacteria bacterium]
MSRVRATAKTPPAAPVVERTAERRDAIDQVLTPVSIAPPESQKSDQQKSPVTLGEIVKTVEGGHAIVTIHKDPTDPQSLIVQKKYKAEHLGLKSNEAACYQRLASHGNKAIEFISQSDDSLYLRIPAGFQVLDDDVLKSLSYETRIDLARQLLTRVLELQKIGILHGDWSNLNLGVSNGKLEVFDFSSSVVCAPGTADTFTPDQTSQTELAHTLVVSLELPDRTQLRFAPQSMKEGAPLDARRDREQAALVMYFILTGGQLPSQTEGLANLRKLPEHMKHSKATAHNSDDKNPEAQLKKLTEMITTMLGERGQQYESIQQCEASFHSTIAENADKTDQPGAAPGDWRDMYHKIKVMMMRRNLSYQEVRLQLEDFREIAQQVGKTSDHSKNFFESHEYRLWTDFISCQTKGGYLYGALENILELEKIYLSKAPSDQHRDLDARQCSLLYALFEATLRIMENEAMGKQSWWKRFRGEPPLKKDIFKMRGAPILATIFAKLFLIFSRCTPHHEDTGENINIHKDIIRSLMFQAHQIAKELSESPSDLSLFSRAFLSLGLIKNTADDDLKNGIEGSKRRSKEIEAYEREIAECTVCLKKPGDTTHSKGLKAKILDLRLKISELNRAERSTQSAPYSRCLEAIVDRTFEQVKDTRAVLPEVCKSFTETG